MRKFYLFVMLCFTVSVVQSQPFSATYTFANVVSGSSGTTDPTPVPTASGLTFGSFNAVGTPANPNAGGRFSFTDWSLGATNGSDVFTGGIVTSEYYQVTLTPSVNYSIDINTITFTLQRSGTGIRQYSVRASLDAFGANLPASINPANANLSVVPTNIFQVTDASTGANTGSTITLDATFDNLTSAVTFRFYGWNAEGAGGTFSIDDVTFNGVATFSGPITPYYSKAVGNLTTLATWGTNTDGTGTAPSNFTADGQVFNVVNSGSVTLDANWTVSGASSYVVVGDGITPQTLIIPDIAVLTGTVNVSTLGTLRLENSTLPTFGTLATGSTVNYAQTAAGYAVPAGGTYSNLSITNGTKTVSGNTITVNGNLVVDGVTAFNGATSTPFSTINLAGNFTLQNSAAFDPSPGGDGGRITINCTGSGTQTFSGGDLLIFRLLTPSSPSTTLNVSLGAGSDMQLANLNGGGLNMQQAAHTLSLNGNTLTMYGAAIFSVTNTGTITGSTTSNLVINKTVGGQPIGSIGFTTGAQQLNNFDYNSSGTGTNNLTLLTPLTVSGNLTMTAGLIIVGANDLAVAGAATGLSTSYVQTNSTGSFILNNVTAARTAPIGNSTYNPLVITNSSSHNWTLRVVDNLNVADPFFASNVLKAVQREWHITPSVNPPASGADIIFQWDDSDPTQIGTSYNPAENVQVWHEIINGSPYGDDWVAAGVSQIATGAPGPGVRTATITGWSWYSPFAVSNISGPLPIKLISFNAVKINDGLAKLNWELAVCCSPDARFEVERSADARNFTVFASVSGSATNRFYLYNDTRLGKGITYYRLKMTDEEGKVSYSKIVAIVNDNSGLVITNVAPNPVSDRALLTLSAGKSGTVSFEVYNLAGAVVKRWTSSLTEGTNIIPVPVGELAAGVYQVQATGQNAKALVRFIKY